MGCIANKLTFGKGKVQIKSWELGHNGFLLKGYIAQKS